MMCHAGLHSSVVARSVTSQQEGSWFDFHVCVVSLCVHENMHVRLIYDPKIKCECEGLLVSFISVLPGDEPVSD